jgi:hypothetical protein
MFNIILFVLQEWVETLPNPPHPEPDPLHNVTISNEKNTSSQVMLH